MKLFTFEKRLNNVINEKNNHLESIRNDIDNEIDVYSRLITDIINKTRFNNELLIQIRNRLLNLLYRIKNTNNMYEVMRLRDSFSYYIKKLNKVLTNNNIDSSSLLNELSNTRSIIASYIRILKREKNINKIIDLNNKPESDPKKIKKLLKQETDYFRRNKLIEKKAEEQQIVPQKKQKKHSSYKFGERLVSLLLTGSLSLGSYVYALSLKDDKEESNADKSESKTIEFILPKPNSIKNVVKRLTIDNIVTATEETYTGQFIDRENEEQVINYICEKEGITEFQFFEIVSCIAIEAGDCCYDEAYDVIVSVRNRTLSNLWVSDCERYTGLDGTSIYNQITWRKPYVQYTGYRPGKAGYDKDQYINSEAYKAVVDFFLSGEKFYEVRTHNFKSFNTHGYAPVEHPVQLNPETRGNDYYSRLNESELLIPVDLNVEQNTLVRKK